ncbi:4-hydroxythreonine-4-phosphate dehydrogenase PdxA [Desulfogranum marinum]|uniref:4-hydroxythreonine-4-phosphate dehydrogenase PdxA n=1 Tax=Desulfogranum marinum TaxID=453220 RepID=UPI001E47B8B7|nr:4-hydroxythreonine-4-phosphate dehydrogenase PdxA [Desulfogranum marinum]
MTTSSSTPDPLGKPLALTMGCPVGIGPEIIIRYFSHPDCPFHEQMVVVGDIAVLRGVIRALSVPLDVVSWSPGEKIEPGTVPVYPVSNLEYDETRWGKPDVETGKVMGQYIEKSVQLVQKDHAAALVTCPISKYSFHLAGYPFPGHTEMLASLTGTKNYRMMMAGEKLRVILVTIHEALEKVPSLLNQNSIVDCIAMTMASLKRDFGLPCPRVAVAALNPHGGEGKMFGDQEELIITPAVQSCRHLGDVSGPWPPDTVFYQAAAGRYDAVIAMYHDQGLIPFKLLHFENGVNVTLGLPIVRTSVDHGTAYDIAGRWLADEKSLAAAVSMAADIVSNRKKAMGR